MRSTHLLTLTLIALALSIPKVTAAETPDGAAMQTDASQQANIERLEKELKEARRNISKLEEELAEARKAGETASQQVAELIAESEDREQAEGPVDTFVSENTNFAETLREQVEQMNELNAGQAGSVTSLGPDQLMLGGVEDVSRLEYLAPGLRYGETGHDARLSMRGARTASVGPESDQVVAVYEDGIYLATTTQLRNAYLDVERIDVLRGPQVTTFGQSAYAGAVSIVSNKPNFDGISGIAEAENGLPDKTRWRLALNLPASDTLAFRVAGLSESRSGWVINNYIEPDSDDMKDRKVQTIRASVLWQPSENFNILFWSRYQDENGTGSAPWGYQQIGAYVNGELKPGNQFAGPGAISDGGPFTVHRNYISTSQFENWVNTLDMNWDMGFANLQWLSNFTSFHGKQVYDNDYTNLGDPTNSPFVGWENKRQTGWSTELRMTSQGDSAFNWLAALYYSDRSSEWGWLEGRDGEFYQPAWDVVGEYSTDTTAVFGQLSYDFTDRFSVTGGLRWNEVNKTYKTGAGGSWDDVLWKAALEYRISDQHMTYFSASTGYRPGGINSATGVNPFWEPEKLTAWELGLKSQFADGRFLMNLAAWYNAFDDVQSQSFLVLPYPGSPEATEYTGNGGALSASGLEAEIQWLPMQQWNISAQLTYTDAKFGDYTAPNLPGLGVIPGHSQGNMLQFDGWRPALSSKWTAGLQTSYTFQFKEWGSVTPYLQTTYFGGYYANDINLAGVRQGSATTTDLRVIWQSPRGNFEFQFYYLNGEDDAKLRWARVYNPAARPEITTLQADWTTPNTYGVIFNYSF
jgi:iron complex outermembrane receptor protein